MTGLLIFLAIVFTFAGAWYLAGWIYAYPKRQHHRVDIRAGTAAPTRSYHYGDKLTEIELSFINKFAYCPDCHEGQLCQGPEGGVTMNIECNNPACGSRFNWCQIWAERISDASPKKEKTDA